MVTTLIWLKLLPCTLIPHKQYTGSSKCTFYPRMRFKQFPLGFALCPKGYFWVKKREKPFFFFDTSKETGLRNNGQYLMGGVRRCVCVCSVTQLCLTLCHPTDYSLPDPSIQGIIQARILYWVATSSARGSSRPRDWAHISCVSCTGRQILYHTHDEMLLPLCLSKSPASPFIDFAWLTLTSLEDLIKFNHILSTSSVSVESFISGSL